ncbi:MAG: DUF4340 domain-containing protein [Gemmatimonadales bacterium]
MNEGTIKRLVAVLAVAVIAWGALAGVGHLRADKETRFSLPRVDSAAVDTIVIARHGDSATLARNVHRWTMNGHPADSSHVHDLLAGLVDSTQWGELVAQSPSSYARLGVDADSGRRVRIVAHGKPPVDFTSGKRTTDWSGLYVRRGSDSAVYALHSSLLGEALTRGADDWRDKRIARVTPESVGSADVQRGAHSVALRKNGGKWSLGSGFADSAAVARTLELYQSFDATGFATDAQADSVRKAKPFARVKLRAKSGAALLDVTFDSSAAGAWVRADSGGPVYKIDSYQLAQLAPPESTFKRRKPAAKPKK